MGIPPNGAGGYQKGTVFIYGTMMRGTKIWEVGLKKQPNLLVDRVSVTLLRMSKRRDSQ